LVEHNWQAKPQTTTFMAKNQTFMNAQFWQRTAFWGISYRELAWVLVFYMVSVVLYDFSISISERAWNPKIPLGQILLSYITQIFLNYFFKIALTLPLWWLFFRRLVHLSLYQKMWLHVFTAPIYVYFSIKSFYWIADLVGIGHLRGYGQIWDYYISFLLYIVQFGIFHAYAYHRHLQRQQKLEAELRQATIQAELTALKAQINPHFLYNTFNTISASVPPEQEHTRELLAELSDMFRYQLQASKVELVTVAEEVAFAKKYLDLEKARMGERLQVQVEMAPEVGDAPILPMILQPLVENSVKHGISPLIEGGVVRIVIAEKNGFIQFEISDTGVGMPPQNTTTDGGIGLKNTQLRLEKMYGTHLTISQNQPRGTRIFFEVKRGAD
jgi:two-component system, LytTR family, sensor kinase